MLRGLSVCDGHTVEPNKMAETIELPFGGRLMWAQGTMSWIRVQVTHGRGTLDWGMSPTLLDS